MTDPELVVRCLAGDGAAWRTLVDRYHGLVLSVAYALGLKAADAEEVFQDTFVSLFEKLDTLRDRGRLGAWLAVTARHKALDRLTRGPAGREVAAPAGFDPASPADLPLDALLRLERQNQVRLALAALPEGCRRLLTVLFYEEPPPSYDEVARRLGMRRGSLGPTRRRCFARMLALLAGMRDESYPGTGRLRQEKRKQP